MMWKRAFLFIAIAAALALWLAPADMIWRWRLTLYDLWPRQPPPSAAARDGAWLEEVTADLRIRLLQKEAEIASLRSRLRHLGELRENAPQLRFAAATLIGVCGVRWGEGAILDCGSQNGVAIGDAVAQGQAMAGVVRRVGLYSAEAALIWSPSFLVAARLVVDGDSGGEGELWAVQGDGKGGARAVCYSRFTKARKGATLFTAEAAGAVPPNLLLGTLDADPGDGAEPGTMEAPLKPAAELRTLDDVLIIRRMAVPPLADTAERAPTAAPRVLP